MLYNCLARLGGFVHPGATGGQRCDALRNIARRALAIAMCLVTANSVSAAFPDNVDLNAVSRTYGQQASQRVKSVQDLVARYSRSPIDQRLQAVNDFFNAVPWRSDPSHWRRNDYWATPLETLLSNGADCEDFAIAKYFTLIRMGVSASHLRFVFAKLAGSREKHVVLAYMPSNGGAALILDNRHRRVRQANRSGDLNPLLSFNTYGAWRGISATPVSNGKGVNGIPAWRQMLRRMRQPLK